MPGKLFEYLGAGKPVLALCGEGEVRRVVDELGAGMCAPPDDVDAIEETLRTLWDHFDGGTIPRASTDLSAYHRRELTGQLASCFDEALGR